MEQFSYSVTACDEGGWYDEIRSALWLKARSDLNIELSHPISVLTVEKKLSGSQLVA